jgi:hypothetical protein
MAFRMALRVAQTFGLGHLLILDLLSNRFENDSGPTVDLARRRRHAGMECCSSATRIRIGSPCRVTPVSRSSCQ